jgi:hypothetical protein
MARHVAKNVGLFSALFGIGWVETECGMELPAANGDNSKEPITCLECKNADEPKMFLGLF